MIAAVPGCQDARHRTPGQVIDQNAVLAGDARRLRQFNVGQQTDPGQHHIRLHDVACGGMYAGGIRSAVDPDDAGITVDLDARLGVHSGKKIGYFCTRNPGEYPGCGLQYLNLQAVLHGDCGHFQADIAGADHDQPRARKKVFAEPFHVAEGAQVMQPGVIGTRALELSRSASCSE